MMRSRATLSILLLLGACSTIRVKTDYDPEANFQRPKTYAWHAQAGKLVGELGQRNDIVDKRIRRAIDTVMAEREFTLLPAEASQSASYWVSYQAAVQSKLNVAYVNDAYGYGPGWGRTYVDAESYDEGTLVVDLIDADSDALVWRGTATATVDKNPTPESSAAKIEEAVRKLLSSFPPK